MNPNHYLAVAIDYLFTHRAGLAGRRRRRQDAGLVVDDRPGRRRTWGGGCSRCRSASSGSCPACSTARSASAARRAPAPRSCAATARVWTTDKDGILLALLAAEILAVTGQDARRSTTPSWPRGSATRPTPRVDAPATREQKAKLGKLSPDAGDGRRSWPASRSPAKLTAAPGNGAAIGGLKVTTENGLVRRAAVRHRGRLQDLRRVVPRPGAPARRCRRRPARSCRRRCRDRRGRRRP